MTLRLKKPLRNPLFLLAAVSAFVLTTVTECSAAALDPPPDYKFHHLEELTPQQHALIQAVKDGDLPAVKRFINRGKVDKDTQDLEDSNSLLHLSIQEQKKDIFDFFLDINCDVDIQNAYGKTPLHTAASMGRQDMVDALLEEDTARVNTQDKDGNTAFHLAISKKYLECVPSFMGARDFNPMLKNKKGFTVGNLLDQQIRGVQGQVALAQDLKTNLLRVFNVTVQDILQQEAPVTHSVKNLAAQVIQQNKKIFLSYCWSRDYSTKPMVDDFETFIKRLGIKNYYRDVREEEGLGMTLGTHIENFMKNAKDADVTVIFLNEDYLKSRNCTYELLQVWDAKAQKFVRVFIIRHPDFGGLFRGADAALPYTQHWGREFQKLRDQKVDPAYWQRHREEEGFVGDIQNSMTSIINELSTHILADYRQLRSKGFEDVFRVALGEENDNLAAAIDEASIPLSPHKVRAEEDERVRKAEQEAAEAQRTESADKLRVKELEAEEARKRIEDLEKQLAESKKREDEQWLVPQGAKAQRAAAEEKVPFERGPEIPLAAQGYEEIYQRFLNGTLIYRPQQESDVGMIKLPITALANPLEGTFDLSRCGDAAKHLSISTGYRKEMKPENAKKLEIWFAPRFLIEKELNATARHFQQIRDKWSDIAPIGIFWTWGGWEDLTRYDYLTTDSLNDISSPDLYVKWRAAPFTQQQLTMNYPFAAHLGPRRVLPSFSCSF